MPICNTIPIADSPRTGRVAFLGLGSNLGDRRGTLIRAVSRLSDDPGIRITSVSSLYETEPVGTPSNQSDFLNAAVAVETELGRRRTVLGGARTIDIDVLLIEGLTHRSVTLIVPHPRMHLRRFVLDPLAEIAPDASHPLLNRTIRQLRDLLDAPQRVRRIRTSQGWHPSIAPVGCQP